MRLPLLAFLASSQILCFAVAPGHCAAATNSVPGSNSHQGTATQDALDGALHTTPLPVRQGADGDGTQSNAGTAAANAAKSNGLLNPVSQQGILSSSQGHQKGLIQRALGGVVSDAGHATMALIGTTIMNQGIDLPPDDASNPEWPFKEPHRKSIYTVDWADGSTAKISRLPDGSLQILGSGRRFVMQPESGGSFALFGDYGSMATVTPRVGGGYTILKDDGEAEQVLPREGGGFTVEGSRGVIATILPGVGGARHMIRGRNCSSGSIF